MSHTTHGLYRAIIWLCAWALHFLAVLGYVHTCISMRSPVSPVLCHIRGEQHSQDKPQTSVQISGAWQMSTGNPSAHFPVWLCCCPSLSQKYNSVVLVLVAAHCHMCTYNCYQIYKKSLACGQCNCFHHPFRSLSFTYCKYSEIWKRIPNIE